MSVSNPVLDLNPESFWGVNYSKMLDPVDFMSSDPDQVASNPCLGIITRIGDQASFEQKSFPLGYLADKHVIIWVHGYNSGNKEVVDDALLHQSAVCKRDNDIFIQVRWPGCDSTTEYGDAKNNIARITSSVHEFFKSMVAKSLDTTLVAHSLGNLLMYRALGLNSPVISNESDDEKVTLKPIQESVYEREFAHIVSLAPAVHDEVLEKGEKFSVVPSLTTDLTIGYSGADLALHGFKFLEFDSALGSNGPENISKMPKNVKYVDIKEAARDMTKGHSHQRLATVQELVRRIFCGEEKFDDGQSYKLSYAGGNITPVNMSKGCCVLL